jgi:hypothetical protein
LSTVDAVQSITNSLYDAFDEGKYAIGVFLDLAKAFDSLDRSKLLVKLDHYGVSNSELSWFKSYFTARKQYVYFDGMKSTLLPVNYGVPQGSIIGPILFIIFMNDIVYSSNQMKFIMCADDTNIFHSSLSLSVHARVVNDELLSVVSWFNTNSLTLNTNKSQFIYLNVNRKKFHQKT